MVWSELQRKILITTLVVDNQKLKTVLFYLISISFFFLLNKSFLGTLQNSMRNFTSEKKHFKCI